MRGCFGCLGVLVCVIILLMMIGTCSDEPTYKNNVSRGTERTQETAVVEPVLTRDEKRFFWATFNVNGVVRAPESEIVWAARFLAEQKMPDPEFQRFRVKIRHYKDFVIKHPDKVTLPAWAKGNLKR